MSPDAKKQEIIRQIQRLATENGGDAPGQVKFASETGIKDHVWRGKFWLNWTEALAEAGFQPNKWKTSYENDDVLAKVGELAKRLGRFPKKVDLSFEANSNPAFPSVAAFQRRWSMSELAQEVRKYSERNIDVELGRFADEYLAAKPATASDDNEDVAEAEAVGYVYMQRHGSDYKIGHTKPLNKRSRQIQIELPNETVLVHSILTDDPVGIEAYWHKRFDSKRTRGEWFKLSKSDIAAFKRWTKVW